MDSKQISKNLNDLREILKELNMMLMITDKEIQLIDPVIDKEYHYYDTEEVANMLAQYKQHLHHNAIARNRSEALHGTSVSAVSSIPTTSLVAGQYYEEHGGYYTGGNIKIGDREYAVIVAPKELGEASVPWKTSDTTTSGANSTNNGKANMDAIIAAGINNHPAAKFCHELNINGFDDWHLPSPDELEICYRYLKPTTQNNNTFSRPLHDAPSGTNPNSVPVGDAYTTSNPSQTSVVDFMEGGDQAFETSNYYWTSMESSSTNSWGQYFYNGNQTGTNKTISRFARAVRWVEI